MSGRNRKVQPIPPRVPRWLAALLPARHRSWIVGDLIEEYESFIFPEKGPRRARIWFWTHFARSVVMNRSAQMKKRIRRDRSTDHSAEVQRTGRIFAESLLTDIRFTFRQILKNPGFGLVIVFTLTLGIGVNTLCFSMVESILLRPLPFPDPDRLARVSLLMPLNPASGSAEPGKMVWSYPKYRLLRESQQIFETTTTYYRSNMILSEMGEPGRFEGEIVGDEYFSILGIVPEYGRDFATEVDGDHSRDQVIILGHDLWERHFGGDPDILGQSVLLDSIPFTVVGILPKGFRGLHTSADFWIPQRSQPVREISYWHQYHVIARLRPDVTWEGAQAAMTVLGERIEAAYPSDEPWGATLEPLNEYRFKPDTRTMILVLFAITGFVLLLTCVNIANLLLSRSMSRQSELAVRTSLGAGRGRLFRQTLTESLTLSVLGGVAGLLLSGVGLLVLRNSDIFGRVGLKGIEIVTFKAMSLNTSVLIFTLVITVLTGVLFGLLPALWVSRMNIASSLRARGRRVAGTGRVLRSGSQGVLIFLESALSLVLLAGAGLLIRTLIQLAAVDLGFDPQRLLAAEISLSRQEYNASAVERFQAQIIERASGYSLSESVAFCENAPFTGGTRQSRVFEAGDRQFDGESGLLVEWNSVSTEYFRTLDIPVLQGRSFSSTDGAGAPPVAILSQEAANHLWPDENCIGKTISIRGLESAEIIGIVGDIRRDRIEDSSDPVVYAHLLQSPRQSGFLLARSHTRAVDLAPAIRAAIHELDSNLPLTTLRPMTDLIADQTWSVRSMTLLLSILTLVTLGLASIGLYGVVSGITRRRTRELGIRIALGASRHEVIRTVIGRPLLLSALGVLVGIALSTVCTRVLVSLLYGVPAVDPVTLIWAAAILLATAALSGFLPVRRVLRIDPIETLRTE